MFIFEYLDVPDVVEVYKYSYLKAKTTFLKHILFERAVVSKSNSCLTTEIEIFVFVSKQKRCPLTGI